MRSLLLAFAAALSLVACSSGGSNSDAKLAATPDETAVANAEKAQAVEETYAELTKMAANAAIISHDLGELGQGNGSWTKTLETCRSLPTFGYAAVSKHNSLWPVPWRDLDGAVAVSCRVFGDQTKLSPPSLTDPAWLGLALTTSEYIQKTQALLPDYSEAQLKQAIKDRQ